MTGSVATPSELIARAKAQAQRRADSLTGLSKWCPQKPTPAQQLFLSLTNTEALYGGAASGGKMLRLDEPVPTPTGWTTIGAIEPGDKLFGADGHLVTVTAVHPIEYNPVSYELAFDDGTQIQACADHLWFTLDARDRAAVQRRTPAFRAKRRACRPARVSGKRSEKFTATIQARNANKIYTYLSVPTGSVKTTRELADTLWAKRGANHTIPVASALELPEAQLPIDPYLLGVWLGDGTSTAGAITTADPEILDAFVQAGFALGKPQRKRNADGSHNAACTVSILGFVEHLRSAGVFNDKHIPAPYLRASIPQRLALLQGLMDTDGCAYKAGSVEFCNTNRRLADCVYELIVSLGWKARMIEGRSTLNGHDHGPKYEMKWTPNRIVFRLDRKAKRQRMPTRGTHYRSIVSITPVAPSPMRCLTIDDPKGLFLVSRSMVPTHNSSALLMDLLQHVDQPRYAGLALRRTYVDLSRPGALMDRAADWLRPTGAQWSEAKKTWRFPSGATISFGHLETEADKYNYQGAELQRICFDELTHFSETQYLFLQTRLRRANGIKVVPSSRAGSNPGGLGHDWVFKRFIDPNTADPTVQFVPAKVRDNPHVDAEEYLRTLSKVDATTRAQLAEGIWVRDSGGQLHSFDRARNLVTELPPLPHGVEWSYALGVDLGSSSLVPTTAFVVVAWHQHEHAVYVALSFDRSGMNTGDIAEQILELSHSFDFERIVVDQGGLGQMIISDLAQRWSIPAEPVQKVNKLGHRRLLNSALQRKELRIVESTNEALILELLSLQWNAAGTDCQAGQPDHLSDALLYVWREADAYMPSAVPVTKSADQKDALAQLAIDARERAIQSSVVRNRKENNRHWSTR